METSPWLQALSDRRTAFPGRPDAEVLLVPRSRESTRPRTIPAPVGTGWKARPTSLSATSPKSLLRRDRSGNRSITSQLDQSATNPDGPMSPSDVLARRSSNVTAALRTRPTNSSAAAADSNLVSGNQRALSLAQFSTTTNPVSNRTTRATKVQRCSACGLPP